MPRGVFKRKQKEDSVPDLVSPQVEGETTQKPSLQETKNECEKRYSLKNDGDRIYVLFDSQPFRTFSKEEHGEDHKKLAESFLNKFNK